MKKFYLLAIYLIGLTVQIYSNDFTKKYSDTTYSKSKFFYDYHYKKQVFQSYHGSKVEKVAVKPWGYFQNRGSIVNIGALGCIDSYGYPDLGLNLGISFIRMNGLTSSIDMGATAYLLWIGGGIGYTHRMNNLAPYILAGGSMTYSGLEDEILTMGSLELGIYRRVSDWFSIKAALRSSLGQLSDGYSYFNYNALIFSAVIDLSGQIPYW